MPKSGAVSKVLKSQENSFGYWPYRLQYAIANRGNGFLQSPSGGSPGRWWEGRSWMIAMLQPGYLPVLYHLVREQRQQRQLRGLLVLCISFLAGDRQSCLLALFLAGLCTGLGMLGKLLGRRPWFGPLQCLLFGNLRSDESLGSSHSLCLAAALSAAD